MIKLKKNKTIIIGESGSGKSYTALNIALKRKGTTFICNGCVSKSYYEKSFPSLKEYEDKDGAYNFIPQRNGKYYIYKSLRQFVPDSEFLHALILGCDYGYFGNDRNATFVFDDNAWVASNSNLLTLWQLSHVDCRIIITADSICDILKIKENDFTKEMVKDISRYWDIVVLANK